MSFTPLSPTFAIAPQLAPADMAGLATAGFRSVINNRPDGEGGPGQPLSADVEAAARAAGLEYVYQPVNGANMQQSDVDTFASLLQTLPEPTLAFCRSGARSTRLYQLAQSDR